MKISGTSTTASIGIRYPPTRTQVILFPGIVTNNPLFWSQLRLIAGANITARAATHKHKKRHLRPDPSEVCLCPFGHTSHYRTGILTPIRGKINDMGAAGLSKALAPDFLPCARAPSPRLVRKLSSRRP